MILFIGNDLYFGFFIVGVCRIRRLLMIGIGRVTGFTFIVLLDVFISKNLVDFR
jgi:hypothetical protein